jgi:hypothetical protein
MKYTAQQKTGKRRTGAVNGFIWRVNSPHLEMFAAQKMLMGGLVL